MTLITLGIIAIAAMGFMIFGAYKISLIIHQMKCKEAENLASFYRELSKDKVLLVSEH